jgi:hypothetical protein
MAENPYGREPLQVTLFDVSAGAPVRSYMFLGAAPENVLAAASRGAPDGARDGRYPRPSGAGPWPKTTWSAADGEVLRRHYGPRWRALLTPRVGAALLAPWAGDGAPPDRGRSGGDAAIDFGNLDDFDDADIVVDDDELARAAEADPDERRKPSGRRFFAEANAPAEAAEPSAPSWDPRTAYVREAAYPEDTYADLRAKIYAATGVPPYRQHLFYTLGEPDGESEGEGEGESAGADASESAGGARGARGARDGDGEPVRVTYRVTAEGALVLVDARRLAADLAAGRGDLVAGVPVDRRLERRKDDVRVDALDAFRALEESPGVYARRVFVADLETLLRPRRAELLKAMADRFQFDLLYYGLVLKYWPQLSPEAFRLAVEAPRELAEEFPALAPPLAAERERLALERRLVDAVYARAKAIGARLERAERGGGLAVTEAAVVVEPRGARTPVAVRNVLDWVPASARLPAAVARVPTAAVGGMTRTDARRVYVVEKTHVTAAALPHAGLIDRFLARVPRRPGVAFAILRGGRRERAAARPQFVYLTLYEDGRYQAESAWREDDRVGFDAVIEQLTEAAGPVIARVNAMGAAALPLGGRLETPAEAARAEGRAAVTGLTVSAFWPHALTSDSFRALRSRWRDYERAGLVSVRGLQQAGAYAFYFRKGVTAYDPRAIERVVSRGGPGGADPGAGSGAPPRQAATNHYAHLTDPAAALRWDYVYPGRLVRIYHRTTDLRVEVVGATMEEFRRIRLYVFAFLDGLLEGPGRLDAKELAARAAAPPGGRLKALQERDPDLYDLKKYDEGATVYSVLCQGDRQPELVPDAEAKAALAAGGKKGDALVRYWNFTEKRPAFYRCPSRDFPFLSFRAGEHPLGYCLPCCKKTRALEGTKIHLVNRLCAEKLEIAADDEALADDPTTSRHVLTYGKPVPPSRIAAPPPVLVEGLFFGAFAPPYVFRLLGVPQDAPALPEAGYFFALADALGLSAVDFARELADAALALRETYRSLAGGGAAVFLSAEDLADAIVGAFAAPPGADDAPAFSPFGPGGAAASVWREVVADLVRIRFDLEVVVFADPSGAGAPTLEAPAAAAARLRASAEVETDVVVLVAHPAGTYPLVAMDQKEFLRRTPGGGAGVARRFFSAAYAPGDVPDRVVEVLRGVAAAAASPPGCAETRGGQFGL